MRVVRVYMDVHLYKEDVLRCIAIAFSHQPLLDTQFVPQILRFSSGGGNKRPCVKQPTTGGVLLRIKSLRLEPNNLVVAGVISHRRPLSFEHPSEFFRARAAQIDRYYAAHTEQPPRSPS